MSLVSYENCVATISNLSARIGDEPIGAQLCDLFEIVLHTYTRRYDSTLSEASYAIAANLMPSEYYRATLDELHLYTVTHNAIAAHDTASVLQRIMQLKTAVDSLAALVNIELNWNYPVE